MEHLRAVKVGILGTGAIGGVFIERLLALGLAPEQITASETRSERRQDVEGRYRINASLTAVEVAQVADILILAIPPAAGAELLAEIAPHMGANDLVVSLMAGISLPYLQHRLPDTNVVRVMPNSPSLIGQGINPVAYGERISPQARQLTDEFLKAMGETLSVQDDQMNLMTALTAVGPTYVLPVLDAMITAGLAQGLDRPTAVRLAVATVVGTARTLEETGLEAEQVKLFTGLRPLKDAEVRTLVTEAIQDALQRMDGLTTKFTQ